MAWTFELVHGPLGRPIGGLAWDGNGMLFSDINNSVILRWDRRNGTVAPARKYTNRTNGIAFGSGGVLYGCQSGSRRIVRFMPDRSATTTATRVAGRVHNNPYFLAVDRQERIWFSDPDHSLMAVGPGPQRFPPLEHQSVLRLTRASRPTFEWRLERMTFDTSAPTGVAVSPDQKTLYVAESDNKPGGARELRAYPVEDDGTLGDHIVLHTFGADRRGLHRGIEGMCIDTAGNIIACAGWRRSGPGPLVYVFSSAGTILETHPVPADLPLNCAFGDDGPESLYVTTAAGHLFRIQSTGRIGHMLYP
jgi:gluconolactonase